MPKEGSAKAIKKNNYFKKLINLAESTPSTLIVGIDNVGSKQMQNIRLALRGKCTLLMGKNTMIRTALRQRIEETGDEGLTNLLAAVNGNMGFIFCKEGQMDAAREVMDEMVVPAAAKAGVLAPIDVTIPAGPTGLEPSQTSFFQALNIPTKIVKGAIEITSDFKICTAGERVVLSAQALLTKMNMKPFEYGMKTISVYQEGNVFDAAVLDISTEVLTAKFMAAANNVAAFGREIGVPTDAGLPHMMCNAFKNVVGLVAEIDFTFELVQEIKDILSDPEKLAAAKAGAAAAAPAAGGAAAGGAAAAAVVEEEEEEEMEFDLFD